MRHMDDEGHYVMAFFAIYDHDTMAAKFGNASSSMGAFWYTKKVVEWHTTGAHAAEDSLTTSFLPRPEAGELSSYCLDDFPTPYRDIFQSGEF